MSTIFKKQNKKTIQQLQQINQNAENLSKTKTAYSYFQQGQDISGLLC